MTIENSRRPRLLAIDDDITVRAMLETALSPHYDIVCLPNGDEVLKTIEKQDSQLLLLDVHIAGDDGFEICERVRAQPGLKRIPILFMTIRKDDATFLRSLAAGGDGHILKPFLVPELRAKIDHLVDAQTAR